MPLRAPLTSSTVVITGASSGVGALTALALAMRHPGVRLVLAARGPEPLERVALACRNRGAAAVAVPTDMADEDGVRQLAATAVREYGRIDAWINNAAVAQWGSLVELPTDELRRVIETNLFGYLHGARAALPHLCADGGVLINNASILGFATVPYLGGYVISKHAVRAMSEVLRQELRVERARSVSVCTLLPGSMDTPLFGRAGNRTAHAVVPPPPVYRPERAALRLIRLLQHPRREAYVGTRAMLLTYAWRVAPGPTAAVMAGYGADAVLAPVPPDPAAPGGAAARIGTFDGAAPPSGNLSIPNDTFAVHGGWLTDRVSALRRATGRGAVSAVRTLLR